MSTKEKLELLSVDVHVRWQGTRHTVRLRDGKTSGHCLTEAARQLGIDVGLIEFGDANDGIEAPSAEGEDETVELSGSFTDMQEDGGGPPSV